MWACPEDIYILRARLILASSSPSSCSTVFILIFLGLYETLSLSLKRNFSFLVCNLRSPEKRPSRDLVPLSFLFYPFIPSPVLDRRVLWRVHLSMSLRETSLLFFPLFFSFYIFATFLFSSLFFFSLLSVMSFSNCKVFWQFAHSKKVPFEIYPSNAIAKFMEAFSFLHLPIVLSFFIPPLPPPPPPPPLKACFQDNRRKTATS